MLIVSPESDTLATITVRGATTTTACTFSGGTVAPAYQTTQVATSGYGFWLSSPLSYGVLMSQSADATNGGRIAGETTSDYNMYFTMTNGTNRGFVFRNSYSTPLVSINGDGMHVKSNVAFTSPAGTKTITAKMLDTGVLSFEGANGQLFSISDSATGTIFSVNDISGIPLIEVTDTGITTFNSTGGFVAYGVSPAVVAAGTVQGTATLLTRPINVVSTVSAGVTDGVLLPVATPGMRVIVMNTSAATLKVYPSSGGQVNSLGTNVAFSLLTATRLEYIATTTTQWYTMQATYG